LLLDNIEKVGKYETLFMKRRTFIKKAGLGLTSIPILNSNLINTSILSADSIFFKLSLAQFSLFQSIMSKKIEVYDFARISREEGFEGLEYVTALYKGGFFNLGKNKFGLKEAKEFAKKSNSKANEFGQENLLLMVDSEGNLSNSDAKESKISIENHHKWIDAASEMNCHSIRVNLYGSPDPKIWKESSIKNLNSLCEYAKDYKINILIENHNNLSSNADLLIEVIKNIEYDNFGTLPDFGGWCLEFDDEIMKKVYSKYRGGRNKDNSGPTSIADACKTLYDRYEGMKKILPYAKGVSAKSHAFDSSGNNTTFDYKRMLKLVKDSGYSGFIGVEYGGFGIDPIQGVRSTRKLLLESAKNL
tara:strand:- start:285 stop:1364 length:1080 start_codon:yes stop_codon:yes gene_type:complete